MSFISFRGGEINYTALGEGEPLILLHGFLGSAAIFKKIVSPLCKTHQVITIDLPGHGKSASFGYVHTMEFMAAAVDAVIEKLSLKKVTIIGHSMGGYVALALSAHFPDRVKSVFLMNSISYADSIEKRLDRDRAISAIKSGHNLYVRQTIRNLFFSQHIIKNKSSFNFALQIALKTPLRGMLAALEGMKNRVDRSLLVKTTEVPVYWIVGLHDVVFSPEIVSAHKKLFTKSRIFYLEKSGHMAMLEEPDRCIEIITALSCKS